MKYTAEGAHNRDFELFGENNSSIGRIVYSGWFSVKADVITGNETFKLAPTNIWQTDLQLKNGDQVIAEIKFNWVGNIVVNITNGRTYLFKSAFWRNKYSVLTEDERNVMELRPEFIWSKFLFNYEIETDDNVEESNNPMLILLFIYCCNQMHSRGFAGATG
jgi:hypothetical protein